MKKHLKSIFFVLGIAGFASSLSAAPGKSVMIKSARGHNLHAVIFEAENPTAQLLVIHGLQSHSGWFLSGEKMAQEGITVLAIDRTGSGLSEGMITKAQDFFADISEGQGYLKSLNPALPIHVHANCFGSRSVIPFIEKFRGVFASSIITAPAIAMEPEADFSRREKACLHKFILSEGLGAKRCIAKMTGSRPGLIKTPLEDEMFVSEGPGFDWIANDQLSRKEFPIPFLVASAQLETVFSAVVRPKLNFDGEVLNPSINSPMLVVLGENDKMVNNEKIENGFIPFLKGRHEVVKLKCEHALEFCEESELEEYRTRMISWIHSFN